MNEFTHELPTPIVGVYALIKEGAIQYIGQSIDLLFRVRQQRTQHKDVMVLYIPCKEEELNELEEHLILKYRPLWNKQGTSIPYRRKGKWVAAENE